MAALLTHDQKAFVRQAIESGRLRSEDDAVREALALWEERERRRTEILMALDAAEASLAGGRRPNHRLAKGRQKSSARDKPPRIASLEGFPETARLKRYRLFSEAASDLDDIWLWVASESGSAKLATAAVEKTVDRFGWLAQFPHLGAKARRWPTP
jgi:putative addiction module CopG family antidote